MKLLSVTIITKNEEKNIKRCLESVKWADEIVVVDSGSTDRTLEICRNNGCKIFKFDWLGFGKTKKYAVNKTSNNWIFSIDADEEVSLELKNRILKILENPQFNGYRIKRNSFYLEKEIKYCGWGRDYTLRLFNKNFGNFNEKIVHESVQIKGKIEKITEVLWHYTYPTISSHIERMNRYAELGAEQNYMRNKKVTVPGAVLRGISKFFQMYFIKLGFLDGKNGFILSYNSAFGVYLKYIKLWQKKIDE